MNNTEINDERSTREYALAKLGEGQPFVYKDDLYYLVQHNERSGFARVVDIDEDFSFENLSYRTERDESGKSDAREVEPVSVEITIKDMQ